jgi:Protein of unknown function (DUF2934)
MAKLMTNMAAKPVSITEPPNESALADTKHENQQKLAALAYEFWQARGCRDGTPEEDWFQAERENAGSKRIDEKEVGSRDSAERSIDAEEADSPVLRFPVRSEVLGDGPHGSGIFGPRWHCCSTTSGP